MREPCIFVHSNNKISRNVVRPNEEEREERGRGGRVPRPERSKSRMHLSTILVPLSSGPYGISWAAMAATAARGQKEERGGEEGREDGREEKEERRR